VELAVNPTESERAVSRAKTYLGNGEPRYHAELAREWLDDWEAMTPDDQSTLARSADLEAVTRHMRDEMCPANEVNDVRIAVNNALNEQTPLDLKVQVSPGSRCFERVEAPVGNRPNFVSLASVEVTSVEWLWPGYIPKGKITDVIGDGDLGKSLVLTDIIARMSRGKPMPDNPDGPMREPIDIVMMVGEDDVSDTVVPRLLAAGADLSRIKVLVGPNAGIDTPIVFPKDMAILERVIHECDAQLLTIDPVMAFLGNVKTGIDSDVRTGLMGPLKEIASRNGCAILSLRHTNKSEGASASMRGGGSVAFRNAARAGLAFGPDYDDDDGERRIMVQSKKNLGKQRPALAYRIESTFERVEPEGVEGTPVVEWDGVVEGATPATVLGPPPRQSGPRDGSLTEAATGWLRDRLADGTAVAAMLIKDEMKAAGYSKNVIGSAKKYARVDSERVSIDASGKGLWMWRLG
jgi:hypothetical protein